MTSPWRDRAVEEVARALCGGDREFQDYCHRDDLGGFWPPRWTQHKLNARAAILAYHRVLREPSEEMLAAGYAEQPHSDFAEDELLATIIAMVDQADKEIQG